LSEATINAVKL